jgi:sterol 24-C-methyltransferase
MASHMPDNYNETRLHRYLAHWNRDKNNLASVDVEAISWPTEEERRERMKNYDQVASDYYDLVSPLYEQGWYVTLPSLSLVQSRG